MKRSSSPSKNNCNDGELNRPRQPDLVYQSEYCQESSYPTASTDLQNPSDQSGSKYTKVSLASNESDNSKQSSDNKDLSIDKKSSESETTSEPDPNEELSLRHLDKLVIHTLRLIQSYTEPVTISPESSSNSRSNSDKTSTASSTSSDSSIIIDKIKHELISGLRRSVPLNHLILVGKENNFDGIGYFPCTHDLCINVYQSKGSLRRHTFSHTGEKPYLCRYPGCDKRYTASDRLAEHMHSHTNQRPYKCDFPECDKAYNDSKTLREHKRTHGEKNFVCTAPYCEKSFHRRTHLKQHLKVHLKENDIGLLLPPTETPKKTSPRSVLNNSDNQHFHISRDP